MAKRNNHDGGRSYGYNPRDRYVSPNAPWHYTGTANGEPACKGYKHEIIHTSHGRTTIRANVTCADCLELMEAPPVGDDCCRTCGELFWKRGDASEADRVAYLADRLCAVCRILPAGYCVIDTGGNCDALQRDIYDPYRAPGERRIGYVLITAAGSPEVPTSTTEPVQLGFYDVNDSWVIQFDCENLAQAVLIASKVSVLHG